MRVSHCVLQDGTPLRALSQAGCFHGTVKQGVPFGTWPAEQQGLMMIMPDGPEPAEARAAALANYLYSLVKRCVHSAHIAPTDT